ncbi:MAG: 4Fe-4S dicluster domain-containing protein [Deltaproteobacteria bacterium]|nr:4Fe-4S dicluster domain-containing protein [Deltaproteobacteria bacterium]
MNYALCKGCRLCIQVCPKHVYTDDGFGKPDGEVRHSEACTGRVQCGQCVDLCPERAIRLVTVNPTLESTIYLLLPNLYLEGKAIGAAEFQVADPTAARGVVQLPGPLDPRDLVACHAALDAAHFWPLLELSGYARHFVDERDPEAALAAWAREQGREPRLVRAGLALCYRALPELGPLKRGKYRLDEILHRLVDEVLHAGLDTEGVGGRAFLTALVLEAYAEPKLPGAKERPIGGLLPPGTSVAWKTPYGEEVPVYAHLERCLGPECALCVTHCPEGGGGPRSAIRMVYEVPQGTIPSLVRGLGAHLLRLDGTHATTAEVEDLRGQRPFTFEVSADYCKSCGLCIVCCPHDVILGAPRQFDLKQVES